MALEFADLFPNQIDKLVIEDIGPEKTKEYDSELIDLLKSIPVPFESKVKAKEYLLNELGDPRLGEFFYTSMKVGADGSVTWGVNISKIIQVIKGGKGSAYYWKALKNLKCPTLVVRGEKSGALLEPVFKKMVKSNKIIKGVEIPGAGHWVHFDRPKEFIGVIQTFLSI